MDALSQNTIKAIKSLIKASEARKEMVRNMVKDFNYRILDELQYEDLLNVLAALDARIYLAIKEENEHIRQKVELECLIQEVKKSLDRYKDVILLFNKPEDLIFVVAKRLELTIANEIKTPFSISETREDQTYWVNFIIKLSDKEVELPPIINKLIIRDCRTVRIKDYRFADRAIRSLK